MPYPSGFESERDVAAAHYRVALEQLKESTEMIQRITSGDFGKIYAQQERRNVLEKLGDALNNANYAEQFGFDEPNAIHGLQKKINKIWQKLNKEIQDHEANP